MKVPTHTMTMIVTASGRRTRNPEMNVRKRLIMRRPSDKASRSASYSAALSGIVCSGITAARGVARHFTLSRKLWNST